MVNALPHRPRDVPVESGDTEGCRCDCEASKGSEEQMERFSCSAQRSFDERSVHA